MDNLKYIFGSFLMVLLCSPWLAAQQNTVSSGGEASGSGGSLSYTVGQIDYSLITDNEGIITEGVQQPYEIYGTTDVDDGRIDLSAQVFPNPAMDRLTLSIDQHLPEDTYFTIHTNDGKLIENGKVSIPLQEIRISELPQGIYFLKVSSQQQTLKTFKIIKKR